MSRGPSLSGLVWLYIATVIVCALGVVAIYALTPGVGRPNAGTSSAELMLVGSLVTLAAFIAEIYPIKIPTTRIFDNVGDEVTVTSSIYIAGLFLYGPAFTMAVAAVSVLCAQIWRRKPFHKTAFNVAVYVLTVGLSGTVLLGTQTNPRSLEAFVSPQGAVLVLATLAVYYLANTSLVSMIVSLVGRTGFIQVWKHNNPQFLPQYVGMLNIGLVAAVLWTLSPVAELLLILPMLVIYVALRATARLKDETLRALVGLAEMVDSRDTYAYRHSIEVARYSSQIAAKMRLPVEEVEAVNLAALLHDIGKIGTPDQILHKPGPLDPEEWQLMKRHPDEGAKVLRFFSLFRWGVDMVLYHQEHFDGSGYPAGLAGLQIPLGARIIHVADAYQAMTSDRVYRRAMSPEVAAGRLLEASGKQFDPRVVKAFVESLREAGVIGGGAAVAPGEARREVPGVTGLGRADSPGPGRSHA